ncbi:unnamed protein product, partial [Adineta steineri]
MDEKLTISLLTSSSDKLPKFSGKNSENMIKWLTKITNELNVFKLYDAQKLRMVPLVLLDDARHVHRSLAIKQIGNRVQGLEETVLHYYLEMMEICDMIDHEMKEELKVGYLLAGIKLSLQKEVMRRNPKNPTEFLTVAQAEEKLDLLINVQTNYDSTLITDSLSAIKPQTKSSLAYKSANTQKPIRCFNCNKIGHIARNCFFKKLLAGANDGTALVNVHHPSLMIISTWINNMKNYVRRDFFDCRPVEDLVVCSWNVVGLRFFGCCDALVA